MPDSWPITDRMAAERLHISVRRVRALAKSAGPVHIRAGQSMNRRIRWHTTSTRVPVAFTGDTPPPAGQ